MDMDGWYWKVVEEEEVQERLALFNRDRKRQWKVMPTRELNKAPTFV